MMTLAVAILIAGHGVMIRYVSSHLALSTGIIAGMAVLVVVKYLGLLGPLHAMGRKLRHKSWRRDPPGR